MMYSLKKVLPTFDNIRTELKQSTGNKGRLRKDLLYVKFACTRCGQDQTPLQGQGVERGGLLSRLYR